MRRLILSALVLLPVLASAQTSTSTATPSSAATLQAKLTPPAAFRPAIAAAAAPNAADIMVPVHETVIDRSGDTPNSSIGYTFADSRPTAPRLLHSVPMQLSLKDMRTEANTTTDIVVHLTVNADGTPANMVIAHSGGAALDPRALEAVAQYRFQPATEDNVPVASTATIAFKLKKS
jgi:TonB family protein